MGVLNRIAAACTLATSLVVCAQAAAFSQLVVFGDSLSDAGNAASITANAFPPSPLPYAGPFTNGPNAAMYMAQYLGVATQLGWPTPSVASNNYAVGGGLNGDGNYNVQIGSPAGLGAAYPLMASTGIAQQITLYQTQHASVARAADTLFMVWGGPNDMFLGLETGADMAQVIGSAVTNLANDVVRLANMGATHILVPGMTDLGKTPEALALGPALSQAFSDVSAGYNAGMNGALGSLDTVLSPLGVQLYRFDTAAFFADVTSRPADFGFTNISQPCFNRNAVPLDFSGVLAGCPGFLYFDNVHPTTSAHQLLAGAFLNAVPETSTPVLMLVGLIAVGAQLRRQMTG